MNTSPHSTVTRRGRQLTIPRRGDLIKLLDSFPADDGTPGHMSAQRLRSALGLEGE